MSTITSNIKGIPTKYLMVGVVLFIIGATINFIYLNTLNEFDLYFIQQPFFKQLISFSPFLILLAPLVIAPLLEEFTFRGWIKGTIYRRILSIVCISFYCYGAFNSLVIVILVGLGISLILFKVKKHRNLLGIICTSLIFGFVHINNFQLPMIMLGGILALTGLGFILAFIALKYTIIHSIIAHAVYNAVLILPLLFGASKAIDKQFEGITYQAELNSISFFNTSKSPYLPTDKALHIFGHPAEIAVELAPFKTNYIYKSKIDNLIKYALSVTAKPDTLINKEELLLDYLEVNQILPDTILKPAYLMEINPEKIKQASKDTYFSTLFLLTDLLRSKFDAPIILNSDQTDVRLNLDMKTLKFRSYTDYKTYLEKAQGITINENTTKQVYFVGFALGE